MKFYRLEEVEVERIPIGGGLEAFNAIPLSLQPPQSGGVGKSLFLARIVDDRMKPRDKSGSPAWTVNVEKYLL